MFANNCCNYDHLGLNVLATILKYPHDMSLMKKHKELRQ